MFDYERQGAIRRLLFRHLDSPSMRHIKDPKQVDRLAEDILSAVDRTPSVWTKWDAARGELLKAAARTWIPIEDLVAFLNGLPGSPLTLTDVAQRLRAFQEEPYARLYPDKRVKEACLAMYESERAAGTELPAIIGALQEFADEEEERLDRERQDRWRQQQEADRLALQGRYLSGADCKWTALEGSKAVFMRKNGRAFRLSPTKDKRWELHRIEEPNDAGDHVGTYATRGAANKVIDKMAYEPVRRW
ncbi:MAG: hypothetical protein Q7T23_11025 [Phenylobacterium sp.]|nr:hypothetical protein [Phenylobacterium sp.]